MGSIMTAPDERPPVAIGHVFVRVGDVRAATEFFVLVGVRPIVEKDDFAVLELRGGTHIVVRAAEEGIEPGTKIPFDFIVDDVRATHQAFVDRGLEPGPLEEGRIHDGFELTAPDGQILKINSTHAGDRPV
jgi:hypothetical protein